MKRKCRDSEWIRNTFLFLLRLQAPARALADPFSLFCVREGCSSRYPIAAQAERGNLARRKRASERRKEGKRGTDSRIVEPSDEGTESLSFLARSEAMERIRGLIALFFVILAIVSLATARSAASEAAGAFRRRRATTTSALRRLKLEVSAASAPLPRRGSSSTPCPGTRSRTSPGQWRRRCERKRERDKKG